MSKRGALTVTTLALLTLCAVAVYQVGAPVEGLAAHHTKTVERAFVVEGMHCASCPVTVRVAAEGVEGVHEARVSMKAGRAWVTFDPAVTNAKAIAAAISRAGYPARLAGKERGG